MEMQNQHHAAESLLPNSQDAQIRAIRTKHATPDIQQSRGFHRTRLIIRILSFLLCIAIIGVLVDAIRGYHNTKDVRNPYRSGSGDFPVWPPTLKMRPTYLLLGAAVVGGILSLVLLLASFNKRVRHMTTVGNVTTIIVTVICLALWIAVTVYYETWDTKYPDYDLLSWTCAHSTPDYDYKDIDFGHTCTEMRFGFWAGVALASLEFVNLIVFVVWWLKSRRSRGGYAKV